MVSTSTVGLGRQLSQGMLIWFADMGQTGAGRRQVSWQVRQEKAGSMGLGAL